MSFILDALKKSETERQRQSVPGLIESAPLPARKRFPVWALALLALLAVNLVVLAIVLTRNPSSSPAPAAASVPVPAVPSAPPAVAAASAPQHFSPLDAPAVYAPEVAPEPVPAPTRSAPTLNRSPPSLAAPVVREPRTRDPVLSADDDKSSQEVLPSINEINLPAGQALPDLHLDVHVFATAPADRFVYINMRKYREGATLAEGPVLERIRRDGVVLNYQGIRFVLPRR